MLGFERKVAARSNVGDRLLKGALDGSELFAAEDRHQPVQGLNNSSPNRPINLWFFPVFEPTAKGLFDHGAWDINVHVFVYVCVQSIRKRLGSVVQERGVIVMEPCKVLASDALKI